jgi:hypothetical protein
LHCVFFGGLLCLLDITHSSVTTFRGGASGWRFDFLSDTVGVVLILLAIHTLRRFTLYGRYQGCLLFAWAVAWLSLLDTIHAHWIYDRSELVRTITAVLSLARLAAVMAFCTAMVTLAGFIGGDAAARSFRTTRLLFAVLYVAPLSLLYFLHLSALAGANVNFRWTGWWVTGILAVFALPLVHFFVSTRRLRVSQDQVPAARFG